MGLIRHLLLKKNQSGKILNKKNTVYFITNTYFQEWLLWTMLQLLGTEDSLLDNSWTTVQANFTSSDLVLDAHTANLKKYVSLNLDGTKWILPSSFIAFSNTSFLSLLPWKKRQNKYINLIIPYKSPNITVKSWNIQKESFVLSNLYSIFTTSI